MTHDEAVDAILLAFQTHWYLAASVTPSFTAPEVRYEGVAKPTLPPSTLPWVQVTVRHVSGRQTTIGSPAIYERSGIVTVQVYSPLAIGLELGRKLVQIAQGAFTAQGGVWFRNVRTIEIGLDGPWYQWNVVAEFQYDELV